MHVSHGKGPACILTWLMAPREVLVCGPESHVVLKVVLHALVHRVYHHELRSQLAKERLSSFRGMV